MRFPVSFSGHSLLLLHSVCEVEKSDSEIEETWKGLVLAFVCWVPFHSFVLLELHLEIVTVEAIQTGLKLGGTLASANSFLNPILYVFIGNDFRRTLKRSVFWRIENAMAEDARTDARNP